MADGMGGKIVGEEIFLGYPCEIYELMGSKQWIYKGVSLKNEMTIMGITTIKTVTSAKFETNVSSSYFELSDFPSVKTEGFMTNQEFSVEMEEDMEDIEKNIEDLKNMSFEEWKELATKEDEELRNMSDKESLETFQMMQKMIKMRN